MKPTLYILSLLGISLVTYGQLPKNDVYLAEFKSLTSQPRLQSLYYLNSWNPNGYNNQATFLTYDELMLSCAIDSQITTDIYHLNLKTKEIFRVTNTEGISEFSPLSYIKDKQFSTVRIEADGKDQSLWIYPLDRSNKGKRLLTKLKNIGYYTWISEELVGLFLVDEPHTLAIADISSGEVTTISDDIGRCLKSDQSNQLYFVHKLRPDLWMLKSYHTIEKTISTICQMPQGREDFDLLIDGSFITGDGSIIKTFQPKKDKNWNAIVDLSVHNINNINRISVVRNRLVFINNK